MGSRLVSTAKNGTLKGFKIAGENQIFYPANATMIGHHVVTFSEKVKNQKAVRYNWIGDASKENLFNKEGFPAEPFRTDDWKTFKKNEKYSFQ